MTREPRPTDDSGPGPIARYLAADHERLDGLLRRATDRLGGAIDMMTYAAFRRGLLRHIGMEEKILLPAARHARGGEPLPTAARLRLDHGALVTLLVPTPTPAIVAAIRTILAGHNLIEEHPDGVYEQCEQLADTAAEALAAELRAAADVPVSAHVDGPLVVAAMRRALVRAGYDPAAMDL